MCRILAVNRCWEMGPPFGRFHVRMVQGGIRGAGRIAGAGCCDKAPAGPRLEPSGSRQPDIRWRHHRASHASGSRVSSRGSGHGKGTRPRIVKDHRQGYVQPFSAACPETATAVGHVCARANTAGMNRHFRGIGEAVPAGRHAPIVLDGAGWHTSKELEGPVNVSQLRLLPHSPEPDPVETLFPVLKHRHFANLVSDSAAHVKETVEEVRNGFTRSREEIMRITAGSWTMP